MQCFSSEEKVVNMSDNTEIKQESAFNSIAQAYENFHHLLLQQQVDISLNKTSNNHFFPINNCNFYGTQQAYIDSNTSHTGHTNSNYSQHVSHGPNTTTYQQTLNVQPNTNYLQYYEPVSPASTLRCTDCDYTCDTFSELFEHRNLSHSSNTQTRTQPSPTPKYKPELTPPYSPLYLSESSSHLPSQVSSCGMTEDAHQSQCSEKVHHRQDNMGKEYMQIKSNVTESLELLGSNKNEDMYVNNSETKSNFNQNDNQNRFNDAVPSLNQEQSSVNQLSKTQCEQLYPNSNAMENHSVAMMRKMSDNTTKGHPVTDGVNWNLDTPTASPDSEDVSWDSSQGIGQHHLVSIVLNMMPPSNTKAAVQLQNRPRESFNINSNDEQNTLNELTVINGQQGKYNVNNLTGTAGSSFTDPDYEYLGKKKCFACNRVFSRPHYLTQHNNAHHSGEKLFKCKTCGKRFFIEAALKYHVLKHTRQKPFGCPICPKGFNHKADLIRHNYVHLGLKPHPCLICEKGFIRKDHMLKHRETHKHRVDSLTSKK